MIDQRARMDRAHAAMMDGMEAFLEIQAGPNPLTAAEIRGLAAKRPERWGKFLKVAEQMDDGRVRGRDYFSAREWAEFSRVGSSGSSMVSRNACVHDVLFGRPCDACAELDREWKRMERA